MLKEGSVNEIIQGVGRLRPARKLKPIDVLIITDIVIPGIVPNVIGQWAEFKKATKRTKITEYLERELAGPTDEIHVASLATETMKRRHPDLFKSDKSAMNARRLVVQNDEINVGKIYEEFSATSRGTLTSLLEEGSRGDTNKEVRVPRVHYGKALSQLATGTYLTTGLSRPTQFIGLVPTNVENVRGGLIQRLTAKIQRVISRLDFTL